MRKILILALACLMLVGAAIAEGDYSLDEDLLIIDEDVTYNDVSWDFPVALEDMDPAMVVLANSMVLLPKGYTTEPLVTVKGRNKGGINIISGSWKLNESCYQALILMARGAEEAGLRIYLKSAYRSWQTQNTMYKNRLAKNHGKDDGWVSKPGASDHQTGLGCDLLDYAWSKKSYMNKDFGKTDLAVWMEEHCAEYGFILRYPADKEDITKINYEPWHFRYVGVPAATYIMENGLCLEEFRQQLDDALDRFVAAGGPESVAAPFRQVSAD